MSARAPASPPIREFELTARLAPLRLRDEASKTALRLKPSMTSGLDEVRE